MPYEWYLIVDVLHLPLLYCNLSHFLLVTWKIGHLRLIAGRRKAYFWYHKKTWLIHCRSFIPSSFSHCFLLIFSFTDLLIHLFMHCFIHSLIHSFISERRWRIDGWQKRHRECFDLVHCAARPFDSSQKWNECCIFCVCFCGVSCFPAECSLSWLSVLIWGFMHACFCELWAIQSFSLSRSLHCLHALLAAFESFEDFFFTKEEQLLFCFANLYLLSYCIPYSCTEWL